MKRCIGSYKILEKIGKGGMSVVYKAVDIRNDQIYALKLMLKEMNVRRFKREFRALARLQHPNIVRVYDFGILGNRAYFTMEFIQGTELKDYVVKTAITEAWNGVHDQESIRKTVELLDAICNPLQYIHSLKIVHRDLKPSNIMVTDTGDIRLMDFGLAKEDSKIDMSLSKSGAFLGTVSYVAPEQGIGREVDQRTDLYSLGVIAYELLTGRLPFTGDNLMSVLMQHIREAPVPLRLLNPAIPEELDKIVIKLLNKEPQDRHRDAGELSQEFQNFLRNQSQQAVSEHLQALADTTPGVKLHLTPHVFVPPLIGRERELLSLKQTIERIKHMQGCCLVISGESGIGKTRLIDEFRQSAVLERIKSVTGSCTEIERFPYQAFHGYFNYLLTNCLKNGESYTQRMLGDSGKVLASIFPPFEKAPGVAQLPPVAELEPQQAKLRVFDTIAGLIKRSTAEGLQIFVLDDLHWADELSLQLLEYLIRNIELQSEKFFSGEPLPILLIATYREEELKGNQGLTGLLKRLNRHKQVESIVLQRLSREQTGEMVCAMVGYTDLDSHFLDQIYRQSEGNPFFIQELVKSYVDEGIVHFESSGVTITTQDETELTIEELQQTSYSQHVKIPRAIADLLSRRIDEIADDTKSVLAQAAVIGAEFDFDLLLMVTEVNEDELLDVIDELIKRRLIEERKTEKRDIFKFQHELIRRLLYEEMVVRRRVRTHKKIAEAMETLYKETISLYASALAYHHYRAGDLIKAVHFLDLAALKAQDEYRNHDTIKYAQLGLELLDQVKEGLAEDKRIWYQRQFLITQAKVMLLIGNASKAQITAERALKLSRVMNDPKALIASLRIQGSIASTLGHLSESMEFFEEALALSVAHNFEEQRLRNLNGIGFIYQQKGEYEKAIQTFETIVRERTPTVANPELGNALINLGVVYNMTGDYQKSLAYYKEAITIFTELGMKARELRAVNNIGVIYYYLYDFPNATEWYARALQLAEQIGERQAVSAILSNLGIIAQEKGYYRDAVTYLEKSLAISREIGDRAGIAYRIGNLAIIRQQEGDSMGVLGLYEEALDISRDLGDKHSAAHTLFWIGNCFQSQENIEMAELFYKQSEELAEKIEFHKLIPMIITCRAQYQAEQGNPEAGLQLVHQALELSEKIGDQEAISFARIIAAKIQLMRSNTAAIRPLVAPILLQAWKNEMRPLRMIGLYLHARALEGMGKLTAAKRAYVEALDEAATIMNQVEPDYVEYFRAKPDVVTLVAYALNVLEASGDISRAEHYRNLFTG